MKAIEKIESSMQPIAVADITSPKGRQRRTPAVALVDDDPHILTSVGILLEAEGYQITTYQDAIAALGGIQDELPDLAILDIKMPRMDGMELLLLLRRTMDIPVIFLTSKGEEVEEILSLKLGADDFIRKPFSPLLLIARVRAVLRRMLWKNGAICITNKGLRRGKLLMEPERQSCSWDNTPLVLTITEFLILHALAERPGIVRSRTALMEAAYEEQECLSDRAIDSHIKRIRTKFRQIDPDFDAIETFYGVGYLYRENRPF
jgi:two-component system response regulator ChvI